LRSTIVAPRTVRANCTQSDRPMATISTQIAMSVAIGGRGEALGDPKIRRATRIGGKVS
jgi:hypothetical protein